MQVMRYLEHLQSGQHEHCGEFVLDQDQIVAFALRHDPQPFHLEEEAAKSSIFGRLTASGLHVASAGRRLVLGTAMQDLRLLGSPGARRFQMHRPVVPGMRVRLDHTVTAVEPIAIAPGVGLVSCTMRGFDDEGELVITIEDFMWVGSRALDPEFDPTALVQSEQASISLGPLLATDSVDATEAGETCDGQIYLEDCPIGATFVSGEHVLTAEGASAFQSDFDVPPLINEWHGPALTMPALAEAFWLRSANMGGTGLDLVRWPHMPHAGDRLRGKLRIAHTRPLRSRPGLGLVRADCVLVNQHSKVLATFAVTTFLRARAALPD